MKYLAIILGLVVFVGIAANVTSPPAPAAIYQYTWTFYDLWNYNYTLTATQLSGTTNIIAVLQENNYISGNTTAWYEVERDTLVGAGTLRLYGGTNTAPSYVKGSGNGGLLPESVRSPVGTR
ncbi:MAG: hypothetical protein IPG32_19340 [Saprospirales bacterium]|nr:hypothetical protein [Saprospirales bacterium]